METNFLVAVLSLAGLGAAGGAESVSFSHDIAPILVKKCIGCHGAEKAKGGYRLHTFDWMVKKGEGDRAPIEPGKPAESEIIVRITSPDEDDRMPQKDDPLPAKEVDLIRRWIQEGAAFDGKDRQSALQTLVPAEAIEPAPRIYSRAIPILSLAFMPGSDDLVVAGYREITRWNATNGTMQARWGELPERIYGLAFASEGGALAVGGGAPGQSGEVAIIDTHSGKATAHFGRTADCVLAVCLSPDGKLLAAGGADHAIRVYELPEGKERLVIQQHADWVTGLAIDATGKRLASASRDGTARVYSVENGQLEATHHDHQAPVWTIAFSGEDVLSGGADKEIHIWSLAEGKKSGEIRGWPTDLFRLLTVDGEVFACSGNVVRQYHVSDRKSVREYSGATDTVYALAYSAARQWLAAGSYDGSVQVWQTKDGAAVGQFAAWPGGDKSATAPQGAQR